MNTNFNHFCDSSNDEQEYPKIRLQRTLTNTFFEIIIGLLLLILWGGIVYKLAISNGEPIPTHIDFSGKADSFESPYWLLLVGGFCTALAVFYMYVAYRPNYLIETSLRNHKHATDKDTGLLGIYLHNRIDIDRHRADIFLSWKPYIILEDNGVCHNTHVLGNNHSCKKGPIALLKNY